MDVGHQRHSAAGDDDKINHWAAWSAGMRNSHENMEFTSLACLGHSPRGFFGQWACWVVWLGLVEFVSLLVSFSCQFRVYSELMCRTVQGTLQRIRAFFAPFGVYAVQFYIQQRVWIIAIKWESLQCESCTLERNSAYAMQIQTPCLQISSC